MNTKAELDSFFSQPVLAVAGVSRSGKKFGNMAFQELRAKGYKVYPLNPAVDEIEGVTCYREIASLPKEVGGLVISLPPAKTEKAVQQAHQAGIRHIFLQQGSESPAALEYCRQNGLEVISGHCVMMFPQARGMHKPHRWLWGLLGKLPR